MLQADAVALVGIDVAIDQLKRESKPRRMHLQTKPSERIMRNVFWF